MSNGIDISGISKSYGTIRALDDISLHVKEGELYGLIGPDGAGKTTLYNILATLILPDHGEATVGGLDVVKDYRRLRTEIGYMPEKFSLYQDLTVKENLEFFASLFGVKVKDNFEMIAPIFGQLERFPNRMASALSGGMKQKLALSCSLIHRPKVLLLDEPTTGVDAVSRSEFWEMLRNLKKYGITILVSTSYMDEATMCDRISMINKGRILGTGTTAELLEGLDENLYNAVADNMFLLLEKLKGMKGVTNCYTFGATLHVVTDADFSVAETVAQLEREGLAGVRIYPAKGTIEDLFIKNSVEDESDRNVDNQIRETL